jgi:hypothetical protein
MPGNQTAPLKPANRAPVFNRETIRRLAPFLLIAVFLAISLASMRHLSLTADEEQHHQYGANILNLDSDRFDDSKMPFSTLNALPGKLASWIPPNRIQFFLARIETGRIATLLFSALAALLVYHWSRSLYGWLPGLFSLLLYIFDPNIIAHSRLATTDIYAAGMVSLAAYTFWRFSIHRDWRHALLSAGALALAQLAKYSGAFLYPLFTLLILIRDAPLLLRMLSAGKYSHLKRYLGRTVLYVLLFILLSLLVINTGFLFNRTFTPLNGYTFRSELFQAIQTRLSPLGGVPIPLPYPYLQGIDLVLFREASGVGYGRIYLLGELRESGGFSGYYLYASLFKLPIAAQLIILASLVLYIIRRRRYHFLRNELFLLGPVLFFVIYFNFFFGAQMGIRLFLVVFPLLYIFCGSLLANWESSSLGAKAALGILVAYLVVSVLSYHPHYLTYFNEIVLDRRRAYKYLADSNLDWGQGQWYLDQYLDAHPNARFEPDHPRDGVSIVSANNLVGVVADQGQFRWLRENFEPDAVIANEYLVYDISTQEFNRTR